MSASRRLLAAWVLRAAALGLAWLLAPAAVGAQQPYPSRTVKLVVPFPPGGASTDGLARAFAQELAKALKATVVVENKPGAGTTLAAMAVKTQPADGHTLLFQSDGLYNARLTQPDLGYEASDFEIIAPLAQTNYALVVPADRGWSRLSDLRVLKRELDVGTLGIGVSSYSILAERMAAQLGLKHRMVPYKGGVEGVTAVMKGEIDGYFATIGLTQTIKDNPKVRVLASTGTPGVRNSLSGVPTFAELGLDGMVFHTYYGLALRAGTPADVKDKLLQAVQAVLRSEEMKAARERLHLEAYPGQVEDYRRDVMRNFKIYEAAVAAQRR